MRATLLLTALLATGLAGAEGLPEGETVPAATASPVAPADCNCPSDAAPIDLGAAPEPEKVVTIQPTGSSASAGGFGAGTRSWIDLQVGGSAASTTARPLPGDAASNVYERYANSFKHPIPEKFNRESFASDGGGK